MENLIKIDTGITGDYTNVGAYNFTFPKIYKQVLGVGINVYKTGTAATLENVYVTGFNNNGYFRDVKEKEGYIVNAFFFQKCKELIKEWIQYRTENGIDVDWFFVTKYRKEYRQMTQGAIRNRIRKLGKIIGIEDLYPHTLRKTAINLINNLAGLGLASSYANHSSSGVTSKHYIAKANPTEIRNSIINARKKLGIF